MKRKYIITALIFIIILTTLFIVFRRSKQIDEDVKLRNQIIKVIQQKDSIDFAKVTNFEWDTMYIFPPYSQPKDILKADGIKSYNSNFSIEFLDDINMIAFTKANKLICFVELPRKYGGETILRDIKFSKNEVKFNISQNNKTIIFDKK